MEDLKEDAGPDDQLEEAYAQPSTGGASGGMYEETIWGTSTYEDYSTGRTYHGDAAKAAAERGFGGPPTDDITGEHGYYGEWGGPYSQPGSGVPGGERPGM